jgi:hypothetical protein
MYLLKKKIKGNLQSEILGNHFRLDSNAMTSWLFVPLTAKKFTLEENNIPNIF